MHPINHAVVTKMQSITCVKQSWFFCCLMNFRSVLSDTSVMREARCFGRAIDFDPRIFLLTTGQKDPLHYITILTLPNSASYAI